MAARLGWAARSAARRRDLDARRRARLRATHQNDQALAEHAELIGTTIGLRRHVLELHAPVGDVYPHLPLLCMGCDGEVGETGEPAQFPCRTYELARTRPSDLDP